MIIQLLFAAALVQVSGTNARIEGETVIARADADGKCAFSLDVRFPEWDDDTYVMLPSGAYDGNRAFAPMKAVNYVLWFDRSMYGEECPYVMNDLIPSLGRDGKGVIEGGVGDLATPAACFFFPKVQKGVIVYHDFQVAGRYTGFYVSNGVFRVQYPARRYELLEGKPDRPDDPPISAKPGQEIRSAFLVHEFPCADVPTLYAEFFRTRKSFLKGERALAPDAKRTAYLTTLTANAIASTTWSGRDPDQNVWWVCGWCGGPIDVAALVRVNYPGVTDLAANTLDFLARTQEKGGLFRGSSRDGVKLPERHYPETLDYQLTRRSADCVFYWYALMARAGSTPAREASVRRCADAFVSMYRRYGQIPEYVNVNDNTPVIGGTTGAAILPAALLKTADYFHDESYARVAAEIAEGMWRKYVSHGLCFGGAGDAANAPDSESCASMLESFVSLAERTGDRTWVARAETTAHILSTWIVSYSFAFPPTCEFARLNVNTVGAVVANLQNRHAAPGFCIDSGSSLVRLAKLTGNKAYRELYDDVKNFIPQVISTPDRPIYGRMVVKEPRLMMYGGCHERVNLSGWEGMGYVGETYWRGAWCMSSYLLMRED